MKRHLARSVSPLSPCLHQRVNSYALMASAAGMSVLSLAQPADAKIIYTPAHVKIVPNHGEIYFDLNHDGVNDFGFYASSARTTSGFLGRLDVGPAKLQQGNGVWSVQSGRHACAAALRKGVRVGPKRPFNSNNVVMAFASSTAGGKGTAFCPWVGLTKSRYLGLKFTIKGKVHFGWARVGGGFLTGYAYENIANKAIITGATGRDEVVEASDASQTAPIPRAASLGFLALGSPGLSIWRRKEQQADSKR